MFNIVNTQLMHIVFMQKPPIQNEADRWYIRPVPGSNGELLLQFYGNGYRDPNWERLGLFFIIIQQSSEAEFKLGSYAEALIDGNFVME